MTNPTGERRWMPDGGEEEAKKVSASECSDYYAGAKTLTGPYQELAALMERRPAEATDTLSNEYEEIKRRMAEISEHVTDIDAYEYPYKEDLRQWTTELGALTAKIEGTIERAKAPEEEGEAA